MTAYDPDCGANAQVSYSIPVKDGFQYPTGLQVDSDSGEICITEPLDYESRQTYDFPVVATDQGAYICACLRACLCSCWYQIVFSRKG